MGIDYCVFPRIDVPTPAALGLGGPLLPWPNADRPWPQTRFEADALAYGERSWLPFPVQRMTAEQRAWITRFTPPTEFVGALSLHDLPLAEWLCAKTRGVLLCDADPDRPQSFDGEPGFAPAARFWLLHGEFRRWPFRGSSTQPDADAVAHIAKAVLAQTAEASGFLRALNPQSISEPKFGLQRVHGQVALAEALWAGARDRTNAEAVVRALIALDYWFVTERPEWPDLSAAAVAAAPALADDVTLFQALGDEDAMARAAVYGTRRALLPDEPAPPLRESPETSFSGL